MDLIINKNDNNYNDEMPMCNLANSNKNINGTDYIYNAYNYLSNIKY